MSVPPMGGGPCSALLGAPLGFLYTISRWCRSCVGPAVGELSPKRKDARTGSYGNRVAGPVQHSDGSGREDMDFEVEDQWVCSHRGSRPFRVPEVGKGRGPISLFFQR